MGGRLLTVLGFAAGREGTGEVAATVDAAAVLGCSPAAELAAAKQQVARLGALVGGLVRSSRLASRRR